MTNRTDVIERTKTTTKVKRPSKYNVVFLNDDYTPMDFVIQVLCDIFRHDAQTAGEIMLEVHHTGRGIAGTYTKEIAETLAMKAESAAHNYKFPLKLAVEKADDGDEG